MDDGMDVEEVEIPLATQHAFLDQAKQYNFVAVKEMVEATPGLVNVQPSGRWSALHQASEAGEELAVRFLLEKGADKTLLTKDGRTALQVAKNAAVRALLGAGEKRAAEVEGYKPAKVAAVAAPVAEVALKVNYVSGEELTSLKWPVAGTVKDLKEELSKYLEPGKVVRSLLKENYALPDGTLQAAGLESEAMLSAVLEAEPALYLFNPCSAAELCERYEDWSAGDDVMVTSDRQHHAMEKAPPEALAVATELRDAMPGLSSHQVCRSSEGDSPGEVLVIVAGEEPQKACLKALRIVVEAEDLNLGDKVNEDDPELKGMWSIATLEQVAWKDYLDKGFNAFPEDTSADLLENGGVEQKELDEFRAGTKVMAEKLQKHFIFGFDDTAVTAPIIYGGYTPEGQIVGVLASRVWT